METMVKTLAEKFFIFNEKEKCYEINKELDLSCFRDLKDKVQFLIEIIYLWEEINPSFDLKSEFKAFPFCPHNSEITNKRFISADTKLEIKKGSFYFVTSSDCKFCKRAENMIIKIFGSVEEFKSLPFYKNEFGFYLSDLENFLAS